ncbi:MAG: class I SAM-dependent methyltransferase [Chloroflexota bacterium]|nr:class I SAM-dependent methyltransferase [Chloroflexota bacterium]
MPVNYDEAVNYYDATRGFRDGVVERYRAALLDCTGAGSSSRFLELGIGSGLIAAPFLRASDDYVGIDLSRGMMGLIGGKLAGAPAPRLAQADCRHLPFAAASFDVIQAARVFHHLPAWRDCIDEARRLLGPGGALVIVENLPPAEAERPPWGIVQDKWDEILRGLGLADDGHGDGIWLTDDSMRRYLESTGASVDFTDLLRFLEKPISPRVMVERRAARMFSSDWPIPAALHRRATRALKAWLEEECAAPDEMVERETIFRALVARW